MPKSTLLGWLSTWWWLCLLLGLGVTFGLPRLLCRTPHGARFVASAGRWMSEYHGTVVSLFVAGMFAIQRTLSGALFYPLLRIIEQLTSR